MVVTTSGPNLRPEVLDAVRACLETLTVHVPAVVERRASRETIEPHPMRRATDHPPVLLVEPPAPAPQTPAPAQTRPRTRVRAKGRGYRPRVTYRVRRAIPARLQPLPAATAIVYAAIQGLPGVTARELQRTLHLRDGQLWGALRRLTLAKLIRADKTK